jgi:hypothetical protein
MNKLSVALALVAGLLGGLLTRSIAPPAAFAQNQAPVAKEIRAQSFTLVDGSNRTVGTFTAEPLGPPAPPPPPGAGRVIPPSSGQPPPLGDRRPATRIVLRDSNGRELWSAGDSAQFRQLGQR